MRKITMFTMETCPHCQRAYRWMDQAKTEHPEFNDVEMVIIDETEQPDLAATFDYYYVPTYYVGDEKIHEGVASLDIVKGVYKKALEG